jgi:hypothetical protein
MKSDSSSSGSKAKRQIIQAAVRDPALPQPIQLAAHRLDQLPPSTTSAGMALRRNQELVRTNTLRLEDGR